jgi:3D (Asp-Asp-Asp) domain-containing protein
VFAQTIEKTALNEAVGFDNYTMTAYCLKGRTSMGHPVRRGVVAADPKLLPLGSMIEVLAGSWTGNYLVSDTGGAIKGRRLDLWTPSCGEAFRFGRRKVRVRVISKPRKT